MQTGMNKIIENAMRKRETAMTGSFVQGLDIVEGDIVQIKAGGHNAGRVGIVTGITFYKKFKDLRFNVMFSDNEAAMFSGDRLVLVRSHSTGNGIK